MTELELIVDLHRTNRRQGPGSDDDARRALELAGLPSADAGATPLTVADIGCGTGAGTLFLAQHLNARVTAVDLFPAFLQELEHRAAAAGLAERVETVAADMADLPFPAGSFDLIWSEGAVYNIGFQNGVRAWRQFLRPGGIMVLSEITWLQRDPPAEIRAFWEEEYPEIAPASAKIAVLEEAGLVVRGFFPLPERSWTAEYYEPLAAGIEAFLARHDHADGARAVAAEYRQEIEQYKRFRRSYSYGMYVAQIPAS